MDKRAYSRLKNKYLPEVENCPISLLVNTVLKTNPYLGLAANIHIIDARSSNSNGKKQRYLQEMQDIFDSFIAQSTSIIESVNKEEQRTIMELIGMINEYLNYLRKWCPIDKYGIYLEEKQMTDILSNIVSKCETALQKYNFAMYNDYKDLLSIVNDYKKKNNLER